MQILLWILRCASSLSIVGSSIIIYMIVSNRKRLQFPQNRILLAMSIIDILQSIATGLANAPAPKSSQRPGAFGTDATCTAQGFFFQMGFAVPLYNATLSLYFLLRIRYNFRRQQFVRIEPYLHGISLLYPLITGIIGVSFGLFTTLPLICWIDLYDSNKCCLVFAFAGLAVFISFGVTMYSIILSFCSLRDMKIYESIARKNNRCDDRATQLTRERWEVVKQLCIYHVGFSITYVWIFIKMICIWLHVTPNTSWCVLAAVFTPLQGLWNLVAYSQPAFSRLRAAKPDKSFVWTIRHTFFDNRIEEVVITEGSVGTNQYPIAARNMLMDEWSLEGHDNVEDNLSNSSRSKVSVSSSRSDFTNPVMNSNQREFDDV